MSACEQKPGAKEAKKEGRAAPVTLVPSDPIKIDFAATRIQYHHGDLYAFDLSEVKLKKVNGQGQVLATYGRPGQGPGEFTIIDDWAVEDSLVKIADFQNLRITFLNPRDSLVRYFNLKKAFLKAYPLSADKYALKTFDTLGNQTVEMLDLLTGQTKPVDTPLPKNNDGGFSSDGLFLGLDNGKFLHISFWVSNFFCFDQEMKVVYQGNTVDGTTEAPKIVEGRLPQGARPVNFWASANSQHFYVYSGAKTKGITSELLGSNALVDVYASTDGAYLRSYLVPRFQGERVLNFCVSEEGLYVLTEGEHIVYYQFPE